MNAAPDQKKKGGRILTAILLLLTVITVVAAILIHRTVRGDALLYLNSRLGHLCAVSHRWVTLAACLMVVATALWLLYRRRVTVRRKQAITTEGASGSQAEISETSGEPALEPTISQPVAASVPDEESLSAIKYTVAESLSGERCCPACGLRLSASAHFCTACGTALPDEAEPAAEKGGVSRQTRIDHTAEPSDFVDIVQQRGTTGSSEQTANDHTLARAVECTIGERR